MKKLELEILGNKWQIDWYILKSQRKWPGLSSNHDYNTFIRNLLNENYSFEDGSNSPKDSFLSAF
jgi:hypothetical protein